MDSPVCPPPICRRADPNNPLATPFARLKFQATDNWKLVGAVFNGDPAPPGVGDPQIRDRNGTAFRLNDHSLAFGEIWYSPNPKASAALPTTYKLGAWYSTSHFADQRFDSAGGLLASPASTGQALQHTGDWAIYGIVDQMVWKREGTEDQGIGIFLEVMGGPSDRNLGNLFIAGGMNWLAPFPERKDDVFGIAFAYLGISPAARRFSRDLVAFGAAGSTYAADETVVEATYTASMNSWLTLQPDIQLVLNPGAGIPGPFGRKALADAVVIGTRATIKFQAICNTARRADDPRRVNGRYARHRRGRLDGVAHRPLRHCRPRSRIARCRRSFSVIEARRQAEEALATAL